MCEHYLLCISSFRRTFYPEDFTFGACVCMCTCVRICVCVCVCVICACACACVCVCPTHPFRYEVSSQDQIILGDPPIARQDWNSLYETHKDPLSLSLNTAFKTTPSGTGGKGRQRARGRGERGPSRGEELFSSLQLLQLLINTDGSNLGQCGGFYFLSLQILFFGRSRRRGRRSVDTRDMELFHLKIT